MELYPDFPFAHFEAAMVYIARGALDRAESLLREGTIVQDRQAHLRQRFPARGLHWLLGLVRLAQGDVHEAEAEFERERASTSGQLYGREFLMNACDGTGFARLAADDPGGAAVHFRNALELFPQHARSLVGLGAAHKAARRLNDADKAFSQATDAIEALRRGGRSSEAALAQAFLNVATGRNPKALECLQMLLDRQEPPFAGWTVPIEPLLHPLHHERGFPQVLERLATRAR
jgi:tetratricopeptide (TPR) repeat protein